jgi:hypothetical protein
MNKPKPVRRDAGTGPTGSWVRERDLAPDWIRAAYDTFVHGRPAGSVVQPRSLDAAASLSAGETEALRAVGFLPNRRTATKAAAARERMAHTFFEILENSAATADVARLLDVDPSRIRQRIRARSLYAFDANGEHRIPLVQFEDGTEVPGLPQIVPALPDDVTPVEFVRWFTNPTTELGDVDAKHRPSPREWLLATGDVALVLRLVAAL